MGKSFPFHQNGGITQGKEQPWGRATAPTPLSGWSLLAPGPKHHAAARRPGPTRQGGSTGGAAAGAGVGRLGAGGPLTFSQPVLEVGVTPSLAVEVDAVPDE